MTPVKKPVAKKPVAKKAVPAKKVAVKTVAKKPVQAPAKPASFSVKSLHSSKRSVWLGILAIVNVIAFIGVLVVNYLAVNLPLGGMSTGALSDLYPNLFVPAGITFSIRGVIYLLTLGLVVFQLVDFFKKQSKGITKRLGIWFVLSCFANMGWIFAWHYKQLLLSVVIMIIFLIILIVLSRKVEIGKSLGSWGQKIFVQLPISVYLGRISVATIANVTTLLVNIERSGRGMSPIFWTNIVIIVAAILALLSLWKKSDIFYALVIIWAFIGIILKRVAVDPIATMSILWTLGICIVVIAGGIGMKFESWKKN